MAFPTFTKRPAPDPFIDQVRPKEPKRNELLLPVCLVDGYGNIIGGEEGYSLPVNIQGGINIGDITIDPNSNTHDGYGSPIGSEGGSLNVNITDDFLPVTSGIGNLNEDGYNTVLALSPSFTNFNFGFTSQSIIITNDSQDSETSGSNIEYSFDNFSSNPGLLFPGDAVTMDDRRRLRVQLRSVGGPHPYRLVVWG